MISDLRGVYADRESNLAAERVRLPKKRAAQESFARLRSLLAHANDKGYATPCGKYLLDIGCRDGAMAIKVQRELKLGYVGLDIVARHLHKVMRRKGLACVADACDLPFAGESFGVVFSHHSLEHIWDCGRACIEVHRVLQPRGLFLIVVPIGKMQLQGNLSKFLYGYFEILWEYYQSFPNNPNREWQQLFVAAAKRE